MCAPMVHSMIQEGKQKLFMKHIMYMTLALIILKYTKWDFSISKRSSGYLGSFDPCANYEVVYYYSLP